MKSALVIQPNGQNQVTSVDMSRGASMNLFGTQTNSELNASGLNGFKMIYYGMDNQPINQAGINRVGMAWMPPHDNEYVVGNVAFVKKNGQVTQEDIQRIFNKKNEQMIHMTELVKTLPFIDMPVVVVVVEVTVIGTETTAEIYHQ
eukprot:1129253_1